MSDNLIVMNIVCTSIMMVAVFITGIRAICCLEGRGRKENKSVLLTDHVIISTNVQAIRLGLMLEGWEKVDEDMAVVMRLDSSKSEGMRKIYAALTYNTEIVIRLVQDL